jgi:hypothetical protein
VIDYTQLPDNLKELDEPEDVKKMGDRLNRAITELQNTIQRIQAPNMRVSVLIFYLRICNMRYSIISAEFVTLNISSVFLIELWEYIFFNYTKPFIFLKK